MFIRQKKIWPGCFFLLTLAVTILALAATESRADTEILNIRHWTAPDHTRIVLDADSVPEFKVSQENDMLFLNLKKTSLGNAIPRQWSLNKPGVSTLRFEQIDADQLQIEIHLVEYQKVDVFKLKKFQDKPDRIVIDIYLKETVPEIAAQPKISALPKKKRIIVIDPGHGGEDPGAIGKSGTYEKNIVLQISRAIEREINGIDGFHAVLTRNGDYYVSFNQRLKKARDLNASLFLSIHADAARSRIARGSSVYCLSTGAASSEAARLLAHNENLSDILGGVPENELNNESNFILVDMFQTNTINLSKLYAEVLIKHLESVNCMKYEIVQEAPFRVLKLPNIPAVLIETAYLSNPGEEHLLKKKDFQKKIAQAIATSVSDYFASSVKDDENEVMPTRLYTVQRGDTLFLIAKRFNTDIKTVLDLNGMEADKKLRIGQKIVVPSTPEERTALEKEKSSPPRPPKQSFLYYTVKKGDTMFLIAKRFNTPIQVLMEVNHMSRGDKLWVGRRITVPVDDARKTQKSDGKETPPTRKNKKAPQYYTVKKGDTLTSIAQKHSTTVTALREANSLNRTRKLFYGQKIKIP